MKKILVIIVSLMLLFNTVYAANEYFNDVLFIGDSRAVGRQSTGVISNATYFAVNGMGLWNMSYSNLDRILENGRFGKIYILLGVNDLSNELVDIDKKYAALLERIRGKQPNAIIFIEANSHVSKSSSRLEFRNSRIDELNNLLSKHANDKDIFYINANEILDDSEGNLNASYTPDGLHLYAKYYEKWCYWLIEHSKGVSMGSGTDDTTSNNCIYNDGGIIEDKWYTTLDGVHYKACTKNHNHQYDIGTHDFVNGKCICGEKKVTTASVTTQITHKKELFSDLLEGHWAYNEVKLMKEAGIVAGNPDGTLGINDKITAEQFLVLLSQVAERKGMTKNIGEAYLVDEMGVNDWSYDLYINLMQVLGNKTDPTKKMGEVEIKLILGNSDKDVLKNYKLPITREKVASITAALINEESTSVNVLAANDWDLVNPIYQQAINKLANKKIFRGAGNGDGTVSVNPNTTITKVEAIAMLSRLYDVL